LPRLAKFTVKAIRLKLGVSHPYATLVRLAEQVLMKELGARESKRKIRGSPVM
jgi:hypothetical protein